MFVLDMIKYEFMNQLEMVQMIKNKIFKNCMVNVIRKKTPVIVKITGVF